MLVKFASFDISESDQQPVESALADPEILERFRKFAAELKRVAPVANDFLYFSCIMMHAGESSLLDKDGEFKKDASGKPLESSWEINEKTGSLKWVCSDPNVRPLKNANGDIFPEIELIKAHKKWIGKPLCLDHKSSSVDFVRGLIVDTYYDRKHKRVIALCALDKQNYPALARQVATGYAASVSMGTAVSRAICYDCGRVAKVESDFCQHMQNKSCYGEINCDLSPMELSIVVNGADPAAKIKHIIAKDLSKAADSLQNYMNNKISQGGVTQEELSGIQKDLQGLTERVTKLVEASSEKDTDSNDTNYGTTQSTQAMAESEISQTPGIAWPQERFASEINDLRTKISSIQQDLTDMIVKNDKEPTMAQEKQAFYQGTVDPTPGKPQYAKDPLNEHDREHEDKQMVGHSPFPGVGPVDGMYPGISESDEARKKRLQRLADVKERQIRREAALEKAKEQITEKKEAYFQGGGDGNEPTPGKPKYTKDPLNEHDREKEDKQMVGRKPFPGVGSVTGLYGDDEKKKEMLARAKLSAKFVKAITADGQADLGRSRWDVFAGKDLILSATINDITGGNASDIMYSSIATEKFGMDVLKKIKSEGFDAAKSALVKNANPGGAAAMTAGGLASDNAPQMPDLTGGSLDAPVDEPVGGGSPEEHVKDLAEKVQQEAQETARMADDLGEAIAAMKGEVSELGDVKPANESDFAGAEGEKVASVRTLQSMRKTLNGMLTSAMEEAVGSLRAHSDELNMASEIYKNKFASFQPAQRKYLDSLSVDAVNDAKRTIADSLNLMSAFVKYAHGTDGLVKRAAAEDMPSSIKKDNKDMEGHDFPKSDDKPKTQDVKPGEDKGKDANKADDMGTENRGLLSPEERGPMISHQMPEHTTTAPMHPSTDVKSFDPGSSADPFDPKNIEKAQHSDDVGYADMKVEVPSGADLTKLPAGTKVTAEFDLNTKEGRAAYRMKLAQKGVDWNEMPGQAHAGKLDQVPSGTGSPSDNHNKVETIEEVHDAAMQLANMPVKVRKQAEAIQQYIKEGKLAVADVDALVAQGVDPEAVKYWKQFWSESKDSEAKDFANKLVQDYSQKKVAEEIEKQEVRIKRAYDLAYELRDREIITTDQIKTQVNEILKWNDDSFESTKKIISKQAMKKTAMPQVGLLHSSDIILPAAESAQTPEHTDLVSVFSNMFANRRF